MAEDLSPELGAVLTCVVNELSLNNKRSLFELALAAFCDELSSSVTIFDEPDALKTVFKEPHWYRTHVTSESKSEYVRMRMSGPSDASSAFLAALVDKYPDFNTIITHESNQLVGAYSVTGRRPSNEDTHLMATFKYNDLPYSLHAVFDGHAGREVASFLEKKFAYCVLAGLHLYNDEESALEFAFEIAHSVCIENWTYGGSTVAAILQKGNQYWAANAGDARAIHIRAGKATRLTKDHKPDLPSERERIERLGGSVYRDGHTWRVKFLAVSRAIGDPDCAPYVTYKPFLSSGTTVPGDIFVIACDGVWDVLTDDRVGELMQDWMRSEAEPIALAKRLVIKAFDIGSTDNLSVVVSKCQ